MIIKGYTSTGILNLTALILSACLTLIMLSCDKDDVQVPQADKDTIVHKLAIVAPIGDEATKIRMERTAEWFIGNFDEALKNDTLKIKLQPEWYDELNADLEELGRQLAAREDVTAIIGPFGNESMAQFAAACQKNRKPLIAPTLTSEEIMRRYAVSNHK